MAPGADVLLGCVLRVLEVVAVDAIGLRALMGRACPLCATIRDALPAAINREPGNTQHAHVLWPLPAGSLGWHRQNTLSGCKCYSPGNLP